MSGTGVIRSHHQDQPASDVPASLMAMKVQKNNCKINNVTYFIG